MSSSPFKPGAGKSSQPTSSQSKDEVLTRSQSLLITAGIAGLIGLFGGATIRFSLANSASARFLNPLQTFPAIPTWASELPAGELSKSDLPEGELSEGSNGEEAPISRFGTVDKSAAPLETTTEEVGEAAPAESGLTGSDTVEADAKSEDTAADSSLDSYSDEGTATEDYASDSYADDGYVDEGYAEGSYADENYPAVEEPSVDDSAYYTDEGQY